MEHQPTTVPSWRRWSFLAFPPLVAILFALALVTPASAATVINQDIPFSFSTVNPCNGENVAFSGVLHFTAHLTFGSNGNVNSANHQNMHVTGVGDQGNTYVGNQETNNVFNSQIGVEQTSMLSFPSISKGSAPNFQVHAIVHTTINPNGTLTAFVDHFTATCQG
jgi:hypothetical protein